MMPSVVATAMRTDYEASPENHREDENYAGNNHDPRRECKDPTGSAALVPPRRRLCRRCRLTVRLRFSHSCQHGRIAPCDGSFGAMNLL